MLEIRAIPGTHEMIVDYAIRNVKRGGRALDLGAWSGALAERLQNVGFQVLAGDIQDTAFRAPVEFLKVDLNQAEFANMFEGEFDLVTSTEVIGYLENPHAFLRNVRALLKPDGIAVITTPNHQNVAGRLKFLARGIVRPFGEGAPGHMTPIFYDLFVREYLPRAQLRLVEYFVHPEGNYPLTTRRYFIPIFKMVAKLLRGPALTGDTIIFVLRRDDR